MQLIGIVVVMDIVYVNLRFLASGILLSNSLQFEIPSKGIVEKKIIRLFVTDI